MTSSSIDHVILEVEKRLVIWQRISEGLGAGRPDVVAIKAIENNLVLTLESSQRITTNLSSTMRGFCATHVANRAAPCGPILFTRRLHRKDTMGANTT